MLIPTFKAIILCHQNVLKPMTSKTIIKDIDNTHAKAIVNPTLGNNLADI